MTHLKTLLCLLARLVRPARGMHVMPRAERADRPADLRPVASRVAPVRSVAARVRPYAPPVAFRDFEPLPADAPDSPSPVRPFVVACERRRDAQARVRADTSRLGTAVLIGIAAPTEVSAR